MTKVYIKNGRNAAVVYHNDVECHKYNQMVKANTPIKAITEEEAVELGLKLCGQCGKDHAYKGVWVGSRKTIRSYHTYEDCCIKLGATTKGGSFSSVPLAEAEERGLKLCPHCAAKGNPEYAKDLRAGKIKERNNPETEKEHKEVVSLTVSPLMIKVELYGTEAQIEEYYIKRAMEIMAGKEKCN